MQFSAANGHIQVYGLQRSLKDDRRIKEPMLQDEKRGESQLSYAVTESTSLRVSLLKLPPAGLAEASSSCASRAWA